MKLASIVLLISTSAFAQARKPPHPPPPPLPPRIINIGPLTLGGKVHVLALLEFVERANEELERATLEKKSFVPKLVQSVDEAAF
jgi:hypothetical protein